MADVAGVGPLVRVRALVDQQVVGLGEVSAAKLADELLLGLGGQPAAARLAVGRELGRLQQGAHGRRGAQVLRFQRLLLRRRYCQVGEVEAGLAFGARTSALPLRFGHVREDRDGRQWKARVHQRRQLGDGAAWQCQWRVAQRPLVEVHCVQCAEAIDTGDVL